MKLKLKILKCHFPPLPPPPPIHPLPFALATRSAHAVNVNARDDLNRWVDHWYFPLFFILCV